MYVECVYPQRVDGCDTTQVALRINYRTMFEATHRNATYETTIYGGWEVRCIGELGVANRKSHSQMQGASHNEP
jgi:hypothetical protein